MKGQDRLTKEFKYAVSDQGTFEGILATYGNVDLGGEMIDPGAFEKTIKENGNVVPLLWQHDSRSPIGSLTVTDTPQGLAVKGSIVTETPVGDYAYKTLLKTPVKGLSIGFDTVKDAWEGRVRHLKEIRLWEGSIVTFPMDTHAMVLSVKAARERKDDFNAELAETQLCAAGWQMISALQDSLYSVFWANMTKADQLAIAQASIQQFSDAYLAWLPEYLDYLTQEYGDMETMSRKQRERKEGRAISAGNQKTLKTAHDHIKSAVDLIYPLWSEEAEAGEAATSDDKAGRKSKPESKPESGHLAASLEQLRSLLRTA